MGLVALRLNLVCKLLEVSSNTNFFLGEKYMKENIFRIIFLTLVFLFIGLYTASSAGYIDYQARNKTVLTEEQIKKFEEDVKNNKPIDISNYLVDKDETYHNNLSKVSMSISKTIGKIFQETLDYLFSELESMMDNK
ncbi:MAG: hypothetical protein E7168_05350 [Firmicutes bacterium]|nr:hypothetical protein [Bacillota bacterium]